MTEQQPEKELVLTQNDDTGEWDSELVYPKPTAVAADK